MPWYILSLLSAAATSSASFVEKNALVTMRSLAFSLRVSYLVAAASIPIVLLTDLSSFGPREYAITLVVATLGSIAYVNVTHGIRRLDVGESAPLLLLSPALTAVLAYIVLNEQLGRLDIAGMLIIIGGAYMLQAGSGGLRGIFRKLSEESGLRYIAQGIILYAVTAVLDRVMLGEIGVSPIAYLAISQLFIPVVMTTHAITTGKRHHVRAALSFPKTCHNANDAGVCDTERNASIKEWLGTAYVMIATIANRFFFMQAAAIAPIGPVTALRRTSALFSALFDGGEGKPRVRRITACVVMLSGVILLALR
jgi:drug/metabolite transporter (DMT)-like permease